MSNIPKLRFKEFSGEWEEKKLAQVCDLKAGKFVSASEISEEQNDESFPCYGGNGLRGYTKTYTHQGNYSLIGRQGALCGNVQFANGKFHATEHAVVVTPSEDNDSHWLYYQLNNLNLNRFATGQAQPGLSVDVISKVIANFPSKPEQHKIASFLSAVDTKIDQLTRKKELFEQYKKGVMQKIFSQELRFKADDGSEFPEWEEKNGNLLFESISNKDHNSDLPILAITQEYGAIPRDMIDYQVSVTDKSIETYKVVEIGDFVISLRSFQGGIEYSNYKGICSPAYVILRKRIEFNNQFYKHYFKTERYIKLMNKNIEGIRDGKMISYKQFSEILIPFPSLDEQTKIASFLSAIDTKIDLVKKQLDEAKNFKKGLLQQMFV